MERNETKRHGEDEAAPSIFLKRLSMDSWILPSSLREDGRPRVARQVFSLSDGRPDVTAVGVAARGAVRVKIAARGAVRVKIAARGRIVGLLGLVSSSAERLM